MRSTKRESMEEKQKRNKGEQQRSKDAAKE